MNTYTRSSTGGSTALSVIIGIISLIVGIWCICTPANTLAAITIVFIAGFFAAGFFDIVLAIFYTRIPGWGWRLCGGIIDILLAIWLCCMPAGEATTVMVYVVGFYIFFYSVMGIAESGHLQRYHVPGWGWMLFFNIIGIIASFLFLMSPVFFGGIFLSWLIGIAFVSYGLFRIILPRA